MTIARGNMNRQLYADGGVKSLMDLLEPETREMVEASRSEIPDVYPEEEKIMEMLRRRYENDPNYQYDETRPYEGPRDMRAGGGITSADAKEMLEAYAPEGERLAFVNPQEEMMLKAMGGAGLPAVAGIPSYFSLSKAFKTIKKSKKPKAIIAKTTKGKGVKFLEGHGSWHHKIPNKEEYISSEEKLFWYNFNPAPLKASATKSLEIP